LCFSVKAKNAISTIRKAGMKKGREKNKTERKEGTEKEKKERKL
jgi:hypothetical protein